MVSTTMRRFVKFFGFPGRHAAGGTPRFCGRQVALFFWLALAGLSCFPGTPASAVILWNDPGSTLIHQNGNGTDLLNGAVKRDDTANDTLYFKFHVNPLSDKDTEEYFAAFELFEGSSERLGIGNALKAWAYSAFFPSGQAGETNNPAGYVDLHTLNPEPAAAGTPGSYQYPRHGKEVTIVFKIQYVPGDDDLVTVWLNPDLGPGANEAYEPEGLTTRFNANARFDEIRLRHGGLGDGWRFSDLAIATAFSDFVDASSARPRAGNSGPLGAQSYDFQSWQKEQGLPRNPVRALLQTRDGYLWLGTDDGVVRFDGLRFVAFGEPEGLKCGPVKTLLEDPQGTIWIGGTSGGLTCWQDSRLATLTRRDGVPGNSINALAADTDGGVWVGTEAGVARWRNGHFQPAAGTAAFAGRNVTALLNDGRGGVWMSVEGMGVYHQTNGRFASLIIPAGEEILKDCHCLFLDKTGRLWLSAGEDCVLCREADHWHWYRLPRNQAKSHVTAFAGDADGSVWAGSAAGGLVQFKDDKMLSPPSGSGLAGSRIESLLTDQQGALWVGTEAGLNRLRRKSIFTLSQSEGLGFGPAQGLAEVSPGIVWVGKPNDGLYRWDGKSFSRLAADGLMPHDSQITALLGARDGSCWVATTNSLLRYKDPIAAADEVTVISPPASGIISLAEDPAGALWVGTRGGELWLFREGAWIAQPGFTQTKPVTALAPAAEGALWVGTDGDGLFEFRKGMVRHLGQPQGLAGNCIRTLYLDEQGTLWIGTGDKGLGRWREGTAANFSGQEGLPDNNIAQILEDGDGRLWLGTSSGIVCVSKHSLDDLAAGRISVIHPQLFGRTEGMLSAECVGGFCPAGLKTRSGLLWFSTLKGVVVVNPQVQPTGARLPRTALEEVMVDGSPTSEFPARGIAPQKDGGAALPAGSPGLLRISPGRHRVEFHYTALASETPDLIRFRYRLEGLDTDWIEAGTRRTAFYSYVPPGTYRFRVAACNTDGIWNEQEAVVGLSVLRYFWQTWWFAVATGLSLLVLVGGTVRITEKRKLQRRLKHLEQERALERERTRIAQDLHDEMGAKLCRISFLSEHARRGLPAQELPGLITSISDASREVLHSLDEIVWAVNPQNDTLEHAASYLGLYAQEYFQLTGIQCELDIPTQLPPHPLSSQTRHHLFLAVHEAFTNILKHSRARQATVAMRLAKATFVIRITDDGTGFDASPNAPAVQAGDGLRNMQRRLADIGGRCEIEIPPGGGTCVSFVITLQQKPKDP